MPTQPESSPTASRDAFIGQGVTWLSRWTLRWLIIAAGAIALGWVVSQLWPILLPIVLAMILTTVLQPPARLLESRAGFPAGLAAATAVVATMGVVALLIVFIAPSIGDEIVQIANSASDGLAQVRDWVQTSSLNVTQNQVDTFVEAAQERLRSSAANIASGVLIGVSAVTNALINTVLTLVLTFFFLKDGRRFLPWVDSLTGPRVGEHLANVGTRAWTTLGDFVRTQALVGLIDAVLIGLGLLIVGVPLALPLAVLTFLAAFAPIIGAVTIGALATLVALVSNGWVAALIVLAIVLVVQQLEGNVFLPYLQGKSLGLHAGVVLLTVVLGSTLFGVAGAFLGVPAVAVLAVVLRYLNDVVETRTTPTQAPTADDDPAAGARRPTGGSASIESPQEDA